MKILLRDIPESAENIIEAVKKEYGIKTNTDAILKIISRYNKLNFNYQSVVNELESNVVRLNEYEEQVEHYLQCLAAQEFAITGLKQLQGEQFKKGGEE